MCCLVTLQYTDVMLLHIFISPSGSNRKQYCYCCLMFDLALALVLVLVLNYWVLNPILVETSVVSSTVFEISTHKARKQLVFPNHPCLMPLLRGNPSEFLDWTYNAKSGGIGILYGLSREVITATVFDFSTPVTHGQTDSQPDGW